VTEDEQGIANPLHAPLYTRLVGGFIRVWKSINIFASASPERLRGYLPERFSLVDDSLLLSISEHEQTGTGPAFGAMIYARARFGDITGRYPIIGFSSSDGYVCASREQLGAPMLLCDHGSLSFEGNTISGEITRHGQPVLSCQVFPLARTQGTVPLWGDGENRLHYKKLPNGDPAGEPLREVLNIRTAVPEAGIVQRSPGRGSLSLRATIWDVHQLDPVVTGASYCHLEGPMLTAVEVLWAR
jgi:hypothetical protein